MTTEQLAQAAESVPAVMFEGRRTVASYERELTRFRCTEVRLLEQLARDEVLLRHKSALIQQREILSEESDHRLLNGLQMIVSLLSLQSRQSTNAAAASQLGVAANRVATIQRIHRRLHSFDGAQSIAFKHFLEDLCRDFSAMLLSEEESARAIVVEGDEVNLPSATGIPLALIVNELITNAAKYGNGTIFVRLESIPGMSHVLSVSNDGPALPEAFDPAACAGLGMKIVRSLVDKIHGELRIGRGDEERGARFAVLFS